MNRTGRSWVFHTSSGLFIFAIIMHGQSSAMEEWETWPLEKLELEVSASRWVPNKLPDQVIQEYVEECIRESLAAQETVPHELNIPYGSKSSQQYDIYGSDLPVDAPIYVWIHGGYWQEGSKDIAAVFASKLHASGIRNIVLDHTLAPTASISEMEQEVIDALGEIVTRYPHAPITIGGHSSGAQLAAMVLHSNKGEPAIFERITGFHLVSGLYDLRPLISTYVNAKLNLTRSSADASSPLRLRRIRQELVEKGPDLKVFVIIAKHDPPIFQQQTQEYYKLLRKTFKNAEFWKSDSDDHFSVIKNMAKDDSEAGKQFGHQISEFKLSKSGSARMLTTPTATVLPIIALTILFWVFG